MNISDLYKSSQANVVMAQANARQMNSASNVSPVENKKAQPSYDYSDIKTQQKVESTQVQVSSLGKLKSSISDTQSAAKDLQKLKSNASTEEMAAAANKMATAYNNTLKVATDSNAGANANAVESRRVGTAMRNGVTGGGLSSELQNAGFSVGENGTIKIDQEKFKAASANDPGGLRKELEKMGQKVEATSAKALDQKGELSASINSLEKRATDLASKASNTSSNSEKTGRYVSPTEIANNAQESIKAFNQKIKAGGAGAESAAKEFANSEAAKELAKAGITQNKDGTLSMDRDKFKSAASGNNSGVGSALEKVGKPTDTTAKPTATVATTTSTKEVVVSNAESRLKEQQQFEAYLNKKYQANSKSLSVQQLAVTA